MRVVALGRKNLLFAGDMEAGENLAALYTVANEHDPIAYLTDVVMRLDLTSADRVDALLPQNWARPP